MGLYNLQDPYSLSTWYEHQGAYDLYAGTDRLLDQARFILESDAYTFQGVSFPKGSDIFISPGQTLSGSINLTPFSYIVSLTGWGIASTSPFALRIFDKSAQTDLYYKQFAAFPNVGSGMDTSGNAGVTQNQPYGPYFFESPLIVLPPGVLQIQITNFPPVSAGPTAPVQLVFGIALPKTPVTLHTRKVTTSTDQSGLPSLLGLIGS